jgi:hypothetical protein
LKLQLVRLEDKYSGLRKSKISFLSNDKMVDTTDTPDIVSDDSQLIYELRDTIMALQTKCDKQEVEMSKLRKELNNERGAAIVREEGALILDKKVLAYMSQIESLNCKIQEAEARHKKSMEAIDKSMSETNGHARGREAAWAGERAK